MRDFLNELDIDFKPDSLAYQIAEILKDAIFRGLLKSGEKLTETNLQKQFNTSRAPIREAFRILENSDLVDIYPRKGAFVKEISEKDIIESFPIRGSLEGLAAKFATPRLSQKNLDEMKYALEKMDTWKKKNGHRNYSKYHWRFHETFINNCGNDQLINLLKTL